MCIRDSMWGCGEYGRLGLGSEDSVDKPGPATDLNEAVVQFSAGGYHTAAVTVEGHLYVWGRGARGQLGQMCADDCFSPIRTVGVGLGCIQKERISSVSCGWYHTLAVTEDGRLFSWGLNEDGQLGTGETRDRPLPTPLELMEEVVVIQVCAARSTSGAVSLEGHAYTWGTGQHGQLGLGSAHVKNVPPARIIGKLAEKRVLQLSMGAQHAGCITHHDRFPKDLHSVFRKGDMESSLFVWGAGNPQGLWKDADPWVPQRIGGATLDSLTMMQYVAGKALSLLVTLEGSVFSWGGSGKFGQLGHGNYDRNMSPKQVLGLSDHVVVQVATSESAHHCVALTDKGKVLSWGKNSDGQLGTGPPSCSAEAEEMGAHCAFPAELNKTRDMRGRRVAQLGVGVAHTGLLILNLSLIHI
eukprot:TRINITY_DN8312_c0_g1_i2.p1 TRINITY_DN8312_c0_g1~~TRINITY_DN8312_c0_g1_i2.p1  ORF type:complete len:412 (-),score=94.36 TRINITY_DN8312_c0_g1_i2:106-1341(-)